MQRVEIRIPLSIIPMNALSGDVLVDLETVSLRIADQVRAFSKTGSHVVRIEEEVFSALRKIGASKLSRSVDGWAFQPQLVVDEANTGNAGFALLHEGFAISGTIERDANGTFRSRLAYTGNAREAALDSDKVRLEQVGHGLKIVGPMGRQRTVPQILADHVTRLIKAVQSKA